jgi:hypothetical protein
MNKINFKGTRVIKKESLKINADEWFLNPLTLQLERNTQKNPLYLTKFFFDDNNNLINYKVEKPKNQNDASKFMLTPSLLIDTNELLKLYGIIDITTLTEFIDNNIDDSYFRTMNRIINCWIRDNFNQLQKTNKILINIYVKLFTKFYNINDKTLTNTIDLFIIKWFKNKNKDDFFLNLGDDLIKYLSNKYEL